MSAASKPIQQLAPGFLSLLNLKNTGLLPDTLEGVVQPGLELEKYFLRGAIQSLSQGVSLGIGSGPGGFNALTGAGGINGSVDFTTPNNEWWWVENLTASTTNLSAGDIFRLAVGYTMPSLGAMQVGPEQGGTMIANQVVSAYATDFWIPPGSTVGLFSQYTIAAAETIAVKMRVARLIG